MHPYRGWPFLSDLHHPVLSAVWAILIHGLLSLVVVLPIILRSRRRVLFGALAFIAGPLLDLDHVVAAESLNPRAMESMSQRPDTHSLLAAVMLTLLALALTRRKLAAWCVFAVVVSHLLFDAAGGSEHWLFPLEHPDSIPWLACPIGIMVLTGISSALARSERSLSTTRHLLLTDADVKPRQP
jgi:LexA-binding, inner membrane-associated putative hydrolase